MKELFYFGCLRKEPGHYLHADQRSESQVARILQVPQNVMRTLDGNYVPTETSEAGVYRYSKIGPCQIVAWHDYTADHRPGSHSTLIGIGFIDAEEMLTMAETKFPAVMSRQKRPTPTLKD